MSGTAAMRPWYTHRWNSATSLRLILTIIPRVPRVLVPSIGAVTTAICLGCMPRERRAAARNLGQILGRHPVRVHAATWRLFYNYSRFMVGYCALLESSAESLRHRVCDESGGSACVRDALDRGRGVIVLTGHIGNWEVGTRMLTLHGVPVNLVMRPERSNPAERWLMRVRRMEGVRVIRVGDGVDSLLAARAALARNEIVAMQGDRAAGPRCLRVNLFGAPVELPLGPFLLAYTHEAPLIPAFITQQGWWHWRSVVGEAIRVPRTGDREADLRHGVERYARDLEAVVRAHPDQWFNFFEVWGDSEAPGP